MFLFDTSTWIELLNNKKKITLPENVLFNICTTPPIVQEVLQGIKIEKNRQLLKNSLEALLILDKNIPFERFIEAAEIYAQGRSRGLTIRSSVDCLISAIAMKHDVKIIHKDRDFEKIARYTKLNQEAFSSFLKKSS